MARESKLDRIERLIEGQTVAMQGQFASLERRIDVLPTREEFASLESRIDDLAVATQRGFLEVAGQFAVIDGRFDGVDARLDGLDRRAGRIETRIEGVETELRLVREQTDRRLIALEARAD